MWWAFRREGPRLALLGSYLTRQEAHAWDRRTAIVVEADNKELARFKAELALLLSPWDESAENP
jgi:hypothetical protein